VEEKAGRQYQDAMTAAKASGVRAARIEGKQASNTEKRVQERKTSWTVKKLSEEYFTQRVAGKSKKTDQGRYNNHLDNPFGKKEPQQIDQLSVDRVRLKLLKSKSPQTVKHILALLTRIIKFGTDRGLCQGLPFSVKMPQVDNTKTEDLSPGQLKKLIKVLETTKYTTAANIMKLALFTGMRRGEIFKLKWEDIDFDRGFIHIMAPKGGVSQKIPLNKNAREVFKSIKEVSQYVFPARGGGPRKDANKDFNHIKTEAGLPKDFRPMHGLRHVFATILASSGDIDLLTLQKLLTHKDQRMTQRYIHYHEEALKRAGDKTDDIMNGAIGPEAEDNKIVGIK
jgi:integrase